MKQDMIVILDLGSEENPRLAREIRALGVYSEIHPHDISREELEALPNVKGVILNGGPNRVVDGVEIDVDTVARLAQDCPTITALKEAGGSVDRVNQLMQKVPEGFAVLCGDDGLTVPFIACGAVGLVSVTANVAPAQMKALVDAALSGDGRRALELQKKYYPLMKGLMSLDVNPVPIKAALAQRGDISWELRLPLAPLAEEKRTVLADLLRRYDLM